MTEFNYAKLITLLYLNDQGEVTPRDLAYAFGLSLQNASTRLRRYYKQGLLGRWRNGREYVYYIKEHGIMRIDWLLTVKRMELGFTRERCPVNRETSIIDVLGDEQDIDYEFDDYELEEDEDNETDEPEKDLIIDDSDVFFKSIERCRVKRFEDDDSSSDEEEVG